MKYHLALITLLLIPFTACNRESPGLSATEKYSGTVKGVPVIFEHFHFTSYRLAEAGKVTEGPLNTERGFENDDDATVFVLDYEKPEREQKYFVRYSSGRVAMLDSGRKVIPGADLKKSETAQGR